MLVLVMLIVHMSVRVFHLVMNVLVFMPLSEVKEHAEGHTGGTDRKRRGRPLAQGDQRDRRANERSQ
jgi:hypothetical protein